MLPAYCREAFTVEIEDGNVICSWSDGTALSMPIRIARENMAKCAAAIAEYDRGNVLRFPRKGRKGGQDKSD